MDKVEKQEIDGQALQLMSQEPEVLKELQLPLGIRLNLGRLLTGKAPPFYGPL